MSVANKPADHCLHCGQALTAVDTPTVRRYAACDRPVFYNPTPSARVTVVDGDELLLCYAAARSDTDGAPGRRRPIVAQN